MGANLNVEERSHCVDCDYRSFGRNGERAGRKERFDTQ